MRICFDMDGTIADLYGVENWLEYIQNRDTKPYETAKVMVNMQVLARLLNKLQKKGYEVGIISWLAKSGTEEYNARTAEAKKAWLNKHLASVTFNFVEIVNYGTDKNVVLRNVDDILFDDEEHNRTTWKGTAYNVDNIIEVLKRL